MKNRISLQEERCLSAKQKVYDLRTALFLIDDFPYEKWNDTLQKLIHDIETFYWEL